MKGLRFFILSSSSLTLYRDFMRALQRLDAAQRQEYLERVRSEFERHRLEHDEEKLKYLLADGRKQLAYLQTLLGMNK